MINILSNVVFVIGFSAIVLFFYSLSKYRNRAAGLFSILCLTVTIYVIGYGFELRSESIEQIKFFIKLEYFGLSFITTVWLLYSYKFYFNEYPSVKLIISVMVIPILTLFFNVTNDYHHLFYRSISAVQYNGALIARLSKGPWYFVNLVYSYSFLLIGGVGFYKAWKDSIYKMRTQYFLMFIGTLFPPIMDSIYLLGMSPYGLDLLPFGFSILAVLHFIALFKYDFLDIGKIIRSVAFTETSDGIIVMDDQSRLVDFNNAAQKIFSYLHAANIGMDLSTNEASKDMVQYKTNPFEIKLIENGDYKYYEFRVKHLIEKNKTVGVIFFVRDITEQKEMIEQLERMACYDDLTQVYNRRMLVEQAKKEALRIQRYHTPFSILMMDIDFFKKINDGYGHLAGDEVIRAVIRSCKKKIRSMDIIGRYGGEEFVIILPDTKLKDSLRIAEDIRNHVENMEVPFGAVTIKVTISIGAASTESDNSKINVMEMINKADLALYNAKNTGRNKVCYYSVEAGTF